MDWQQVASIGIVLLATGLLVRRYAARRSRESGCGDCSCAEQSTEAHLRSGVGPPEGSTGNVDRAELAEFIQRLKIGSEKGTLRHN